VFLELLKQHHAIEFAQCKIAQVEFLRSTGDPLQPSGTSAIQGKHHYSQIIAECYPKPQGESCPVVFKDLLNFRGGLQTSINAPFVA